MKKFVLHPEAPVLRRYVVIFRDERGQDRATIVVAGGPLEASLRVSVNNPHARRLKVMTAPSVRLEKTEES